MSYSIVSKALIEEQTRTLERENIFLVNAKKGLLKREELAQHLSNLRYLFEQSGTYFKRAAERAVAIGQPELADFYLTKLSEESGHDKWAEDDLEKLGFAPAATPEEGITKEAMELLRFINSIIDQDPKLLLGYMLFAEYFTVLAAGEFISNLESQCGISRDSVTAIGNHQEADESHVKDDLDTIDRFITEPLSAMKLFSTIKLSAEHMSKCMASSIGMRT